MSTVFRATGAHDLLAIVPALAGFSPERSLVCVAFAGNRSVGVLRHDLPRRARDRAAVVTAIIGTLCRMPDVDGVVPIVYTDRAFAEGGGPPERSLLALVARRAEEAGFTVRDLLCRAGDAWGSMLDPDTPLGGHPISAIEGNPLAAAALAGGRPGPPGAGAILGDRDERLASEIAGMLDALANTEQIEAMLTRLGEEADPVALVEALVETSPRRQPAIRLAWLVHLADHPMMRDAMMLQFAFGRVIGEAALVDAETSCDGSDQDDRDADDLAELLARLLLGESSLRPDPARVDRALGVLRLTIPNAPSGSRPGLLCIAAWLAWSLGRGSVAGALLDQARAVAPDHTMTSLLSSFIASGALPEWAFSARGDGRGAEDGDRSGVSDP